jgi:hypothetical protein
LLVLLAGVLMLIPMMLLAVTMLEINLAEWLESASTVVRSDTTSRIVLIQRLTVRSLANVSTVVSWDIANRIAKIPKLIVHLPETATSVKNKDIELQIALKNLHQSVVSVKEVSEAKLHCWTRLTHLEHYSEACTAPRIDMFDPDLPEMTSGEAWTALLKADKEKDLDDVLEVSYIPFDKTVLTRFRHSNAMPRLCTLLENQLISLISRLASVVRDWTFIWLLL